MVRIHLAPAESQVRTCLSREFVSVRRENDEPRIARTETRMLPGTTGVTIFPNRSFNAVLSSIASANSRFSLAFSASKGRGRFVDLSVLRRERNESREREPLWRRQKSVSKR